MVLVTRKAPDFTAHAVLKNGKIINDFNFNSYIKNNITFLFFWPMDFTFVCPSELIAIDKRYKLFKDRNTKIVGVSCDTEFVHRTWRQTPINQGGIGLINYPMIADTKHTIMKDYGIEHPIEGVALRGSFLIDKNMIVRHQAINDLPLGRNIDEIIRIIDALNFYEQHGHVCPAQWKIGDEGINPTKEGISKYLTNNISKL